MSAPKYVPRWDVPLGCMPLKTLLFVSINPILADTPEAGVCLLMYPSGVY